MCDGEDSMAWFTMMLSTKDGNFSYFLFTSKSHKYLSQALKRIRLISSHPS